MKSSSGLLIAVVGNSGVGKTTFVQRLCTTAGFTCGLEGQTDRPFQDLFAKNLERYALANQVDYLLLRAEQERVLRQSGGVGVVDGGLDQDFQVFTRLFFRRGYLSETEFSLCERLYIFMRQALPPPDLTVWLQAPLGVIERRFSNRQRELQIAQLVDLRQVGELLQDWLELVPPERLYIIDTSLEGMDYAATIAAMLPALEELNRSPQNHF